VIDLRSDTVTQPSAGMRRVMAEAEVGDDVLGDDPTVRQLEEAVAALLGKEDAVYVPSGTMSNQIALRTHTEPGDVVLAAHDAHIDSHEMGAANALSGLTIRQLSGERGMFEAHQVGAEFPKPVKGIPEHLMPPVTLVACENTHNGAGGTVWPLSRIEAVAAAAHAGGAATHLDGARLWNAAVAGGLSEADYAAPFDSVSVCFSKGLGAPMGSALAGSRAVVARARRFKQMYGGGFRQAGIVAAAALYALEHNRERLGEDHANAARLAGGLGESPAIELESPEVDTNLVYFDTTTMAAADFCAALRDEGVAMLPMGDARVRAVTHMGVSTADIDQALHAISRVLNAS